MTDRELLELLLQKVSGLDGKVTALDDKVNTLDDKISAIEANMATKSDLERTEANMATKSDVERIVIEQQKDVMAILQLINTKMDNQAEILKVLSSRSIEQEAEISVLKRAK